MTTNTTRTMTMSWLLILLAGCSTDTREQVDMWEVGERHPDMLRTPDMSVMTEDRGMLDTGGGEDLSEVDQPVDMPAWSTPEGMVNIPQGSFIMGTSLEENFNAHLQSEYPPHQVYLSRYAIDRYEVTVAQYAECVEQGACLPLGEATLFGELCNDDVVERADHPINCVDWERANTFCKWVGKKLPTEAQWEKAASGPESLAYPWGDSPEPSCEYAVIKQCERGTTWAVGEHPKDISPYGVHDLMGNVQEWARNPFYAYPMEGSLDDPAQDDERMGEQTANYKGESFFSGSADTIRVSTRNSANYTASLPYIGFRCVYEGPETSP